ncbi:MAG TPA: ABC transporter ATP-binding protein [Bryobacteraceae bacterium]|jgi:ATP-binding cassette subfamily B protein|nr:ABC transporter ATP-binding protein [Bryobacteraceae bacterium]
MNYKLETSRGPKAGAPKPKLTFKAAAARLSPLLVGEGKSVAISLIAIGVSSGAMLVGPTIISHIIDTYIRLKDTHGLLIFSGLLLGIYIIGATASYVQVRTMGGVGRRVLFALRNTLFKKLQELPVAFFNQNKAGDLISRLNNDTDKLNQFVSQALMQFVGSFVQITGAGIFLLTLNPRLGLAALMPALAALIVTKSSSTWVKNKNVKSLQGLGGMSGEIQESLNNFKVIVAFNRVDYFRRKFEKANQNNYVASTGAGIANNLFLPLYALFGTLAQLVVLSYGIYLIGEKEMTPGLLIGYLLYVNNFYFPLRQLATVWSSFQLGVAALERISEVLALESNMPVIPAGAPESDTVLEFRNVHFRYPDGKEVLHNISFELEEGKSYALVGPTGGGKTTTASLMARLYDPSEGSVYLNGRDIRSYAPEVRTKKIGFILQDPFLFSGTVAENITYGNDEYRNYSSAQLSRVLEDANLSSLMARFSEGLDTKVAASGNSISLGQKQLIAFMRATLRRPELLILDEATANIDTVTEQLLEEILAKLPAKTTKVIIAHRLNTIDNVDQIFFVNSGEIKAAGSMEHAVEMLLHGRRES